METTTHAQERPETAEHYLQEMVDRLAQHGETKHEWLCAIWRMKQWRQVAEQLGAAHYVIDPDIRAAKHRAALESYSNLVRLGD